MRRTIVGTFVTSVTCDCRRIPMTEPAAAPSGPGSTAASPEVRRNPVSTHPIASLLIGLLLLASIFFALYVPLYGRLTPKVGAWPFFYFYLLAFMPVMAVVLWVVTLLQRRFDTEAGGPR
jgi:drug/metabolite transporter (DMT)-like permease